MDKSLPVAQHQWTIVVRDANGSGPQGKLGPHGMELYAMLDGKVLNLVLKIACPRHLSEPSLTPLSVSPNGICFPRVFLFFLFTISTLDLPPFLPFTTYGTYRDSPRTDGLTKDREEIRIKENEVRADGGKSR